MELWADVCVANASAGTRACFVNATDTVPLISINFRNVVFDFKVHLCTSHELATTRRYASFSIAITVSLCFYMYSPVDLC